MNRLLVIGGPSFDVLHLEDRTVECAGGAGLYTAMAACRCGAQVSLFGHRPDPCPEFLQPVASHLSEWHGPVIPLAQLPQFEISHRESKTEYLKMSLDVEKNLSPSLLPGDLSKYDIVHVTPLGNTQTQLSFIQACRQHGAKPISAGTGLFILEKQKEIVRTVIKQCDFFFMNQQEAEIMFGSLKSAKTQPGKVLFITMGAQGVCIIQGDTATMIPAVTATVLDPTGAGDTFCGATLAYLLQNEHPIMAARHAAVLAAEMIAYVGPTALLSEDPPPKVPLDARVRVDQSQVRKVAEKVAILPDLSPFSFTGTAYPPVGYDKAFDYFFAATLQQFSFWSVSDNRYDQPLIARIGGAVLKGSDYLWAAYMRKLEQDADFCTPERQATLNWEEMLEVYRADNGDDPMPALDLHLEQANQYGRDMLALQLTPQIVLENALASPQPLRTFMSMLDHIGGYKEDPLRKKSMLLAVILNQRPEKFLPLRNDEQIAPVIDYHLMRSCLRIGLIHVVDGGLYDKLSNRQLLSLEEEWVVRFAAYRAMEQVVSVSGKTEGAVDYYFFRSRKRCPEMTEPDCYICLMDPVCAHRKELFQPVLQTTFY